MIDIIQSNLALLPFAYVATLKIACLCCVLGAVVCITNKSRW